MARSRNQKSKLYYLIKIFMEYTDKSHALSLAEIMQHLAHYDIPVERKSLYQDFEELRHLGYKIISFKQGHTTLYRLENPIFDIPELKLLVDSIQSAKFITENKSRQLIKKLSKFSSCYEANQLNRQITIIGRAKSSNETVYNSIDKIHSAINSNKQIRFQYFTWDINKRQQVKRGGEYYIISPWTLQLENGNYYLIGYNSIENKIKHYRVDKIIHLSILPEMREGKEYYEKMDIAQYTKERFNMFDGEIEHVVFHVNKELAGVFIDRFGKEVFMIPSTDGEWFESRIDIAISNQFLGWVISLGEGITIISPTSVLERMQNLLHMLSNKYNK